MKWDTDWMIRLEREIAFNPQSRAIGHAACLGGIDECQVHGVNQPIDAAGGYDPPVHAIGDQLGGAAGVGGDDRGFQRHRDVPKQGVVHPGAEARGCVEPCFSFNT